MIPAGTWDFSWVECHKFNTTNPTNPVILNGTLLNPLAFVDFNLLLTDPPNLISYTTYGVYYFIKTTIIVQNEAVETCISCNDACNNSKFIIKELSLISSSPQCWFIPSDIRINLYLFDISEVTNVFYSSGGELGNAFVSAYCDDTSNIIIGDSSTTFVVTTKDLISNAININYNDSLVTPPLGVTNVQNAIDSLKQPEALVNVTYNDSETPHTSATNVQDAIDSAKQALNASGVAYNDTYINPPLHSSNVQGAIDALKIYPNYIESVKTITVDNTIGSSSYPVFKTLAETVAVVTSNAGYKYKIEINSAETLNSNVYDYGVPMYPMWSGSFETTIQGGLLHEITLTTGCQITNVDNYSYLCFNFQGAPNANIFVNDNTIYEFKYCLFQGDQTTTLMPNVIGGTFIFTNCTFGIFSNSYVFATITQNSNIIFNNVYVQTNLRFNIQNCTVECLYLW